MEFCQHLSFLTRTIVNAPFILLIINKISAVIFLNLYFLSVTRKPTLRVSTVKTALQLLNQTLIIQRVAKNLFDLSKSSGT